MKKKLVFLLLLTILLTLTLVGASLNYLLHAYYEEQADREFQRLYTDAFHELEAYATRTRDMSVTLSERQDMVERVSMIYRYADPANYEPLIFDGEKRAIAEELLGRARASNLSQLRVYSSSGELIAFFSGAPGYGSYREDGEQYYLMLDEQGRWREQRPPESLHGGYDFEANLNSHYHVHNERLTIATSAPIVRRFADGEEERVGYVLAERFVDQELISSVIANTGVDFSIQDERGEAIGSVHSLPQELLVTAGSFDWGRHNEGNWPLAQTEDDEHFHSVVRMQVDNGDAVYLLGEVDRSQVATAVGRANQAVLPLLLISALIILPFGMFAANRAISRPTAALLNGVEAMRRGDYSQRVSPSSNDELGSLAVAFNEMATQIQQRNAELVEGENKYRNLVENIPQKIFYKDGNSVYVSCNRSFADELGIEPEAIVGKTDLDFFAPELAEKYRNDDERIMALGLMTELEESFENSQGERITVHTVKTPVRDDHNKVIGILGVFWDITERKRAEDELKLAAAVFENTAEGVMITDPDLKITMVNRAFSEITGYSEEEVLGKTPTVRRSERHDKAFYEEMWQDIVQSGSWRGEIWNRRKSGEVYPEWVTISTILNDRGEVNHYVAVFSDISTIKHAQTQLDHLAHHDPLTDLPNRLLLDDRLEHAILRASRGKEQIAVLFLDLDRFKNVNDTLGHPIGDRLLVKVSERLKSCLRDSDTVARLGGDEFIVLVESFERIEEIEVVAEKIQKSIAEAFHLDEHELYVGASIGISTYPADGEDAATLIKNADAAMYRSKEAGRNTFNFYTEELTVEAERRLRLEGALRHAVSRGEMELYYQPKIQLTSAEVVGAEALLRWNHPELGMVPPDHFIPLAEDNGSILEIGAWVLGEAAAQLRRWRDEGLPLQQVAINISSLQIQRSDLVAQVREALEANQLSPESLELEITESVLMAHPEQAITILDELRAIGVQLSVDDFGTGYSSLSYLKRFPINCLKIDKSFVQDIPGDSNDTAITKAVIALAHSLQLSVVAEGVENEEQRWLLIGEGCELAQGYHFSRPLPVKEFVEYCKG